MQELVEDDFELVERELFVVVADVSHYECAKSLKFLLLLRDAFDSLFVEVEEYADLLPTYHLEIFA